MPLYARRILPSTPCQAAVQPPDVFLQRINSILLPVDQRYNSSSEEKMKTEFSEVKNCRNARHCPLGRGCLGVYPPPAGLCPQKCVVYTIHFCNGNLDYCNGPATENATTGDKNTVQNCHSSTAPDETAVMARTRGRNSQPGQAM